jgi:hypothetical protein
MSLTSKIGGGILRLGANVARSAAAKGATKTRDAVKNGIRNKRVADSKKVPKSQRTKKQQTARDKKAADIKAKRQAARAKRDAKIKNKTTGIKGRFAKALGAGGLGGLVGSLLGGGKDANDPTPKDGVGKPQPQQKATSNVPDDKPIDLSWLPQAMAVSIPTIKDDEERRTYSLSNVIVTKDIELDEEGGIPFIESGTLIPTRIAEIGTLFAITDTLRDQVTDLNKQMFIANSNLKQIKKQLGLAIAQNAATNRKNERRRDEEAVEGGRIKKAARFVGGAAAAYVTVKTLGMLQRMANVAMLGAIALFADDIAAMISSDDEGEELPLVEDQDEALDYADEQLDAMEGDDTTGTGVNPTEEEISEEAAEPQSELADTLESAADAMSEGAAGTLLDVGMIAGVGSMVAGALGATAVAAAATTGAAAATALGAGMAIGTIITDNTQIDENISQAYEDFNEENLDEMTSREEMIQKYGDAQGTVGFFGDLLGEGLFDTEEDPKDIYAAFRDMTWDDHAKLNEAYQEEYGQSLASATWKAVGDAGSEAINDLISKNTMDKHLAETPKTQGARRMQGQRRREEAATALEEVGGLSEAQDIALMRTSEPLTIERENFIMDFEATQLRAKEAEDNLAAFKAEHGEPDTESIRNWGMGDFLFPAYSDPKLQEKFLELNKQVTDAEYFKEKMFVAEKARLLGVDAKELMHDPLDFSFEMRDWLIENNISKPQQITTYGEIVRRFNYAVMKRLHQDSKAYFGEDALTPNPKANEVPQDIQASSLGIYNSMSKSELADEAMKGNADPAFHTAMIEAGFSDEEVDIAIRKGRAIARQNAIENRKQLDEQQRVEEDVTTTLIPTDELNSKVDTVVDETLDEKIKSVIVPIVQNAGPQKERGIPSGTTMTPTLETATPQFVAVDPFLTNRRQT